MSVFGAVSLALILAGCSTTNSIPYKASTENVIAIQSSLKGSNKTVKVGSVSMLPGVEEAPLCRLMGPVKVAPGKSIAQYLNDALLEELFLAQVHNQNSTNIIDIKIERLAFSSVSPANWDIAVRVSSSNSPGYSTAVKYAFDTSWDAMSACKNVADAFGPATQSLIKQIVTNSQFSSLAK